MDQDVSEELIEAGRGYESLFVPVLSEAWTKHLVDGAGLREGSHVLDVACGTDVLARNALARAGANGGQVLADAIGGDLERFDVFSRVRHFKLPGGKWFANPALAVGMLYFRLKDLL